MKKLMSNHLETKAIHAGEEPKIAENASGDVVIPIHLSTTFARHQVEIPTGGYEYTRSLNPTRAALEQKLAAIENTQYGLAFSSGLAAENAILMGLLKSGDHVLAGNDLYGGTKRLLRNVLAPYGISVTLTDFTNSETIQSAIQPNTRIMWVESLSNPLLEFVDIKMLSDIAHAHNLLLVVDNTFLTPYYLHPLDLGADLVMHSATKSWGGHSDVLGGVVMTGNKELFEKIQYYQNAAGAVMAPFDSFMLMRGIKTLALRMERHSENALKIAQFLQQHKRVEKVIYPGLSSYPQHDLIKRYVSGFGGMVTFTLKGTLEEAKVFLSKLKTIALAESLGGVESLIELPSLMTHSSVPQQERKKAGISDTLVRFSVGVEHVDDLIYDLEQALA